MREPEKARSVLLLGATGLVGSQCLDRFLAGTFAFMIPSQWQPTPVDRLAAAILNAAMEARPGLRIYESGEILKGPAGRADR